jgi:Skp family chaperone for outer membrane proteins
MKTSIVFLFCIFSAIFVNAQNEKVIGEKSKGIIGEKGQKGIIGEKGQEARFTKLRNELNSIYADYLKKQQAAESAADALRKKLQETMKNLEAADKLGNFEIQNLMSEFNQAETLRSQALKKIEETKKSVVSKL